MAEWLIISRFVVIGVNVGDGFRPAEEIGSMTGILMQVAMIPSLERISDQIKMCDIYIKPDLKDNSTASFGNYVEILELGYAAGEENRPKFKELAKKLNKTTIDKEYKGIPFEPNPIKISKIDLKGNDLVSENLILSKLGIINGDTVNRNEIEEGVRRVFGINSFKKVLYHIDKINADNYKLTIKLREKPPATLKASVHYDNIFKIGVVMNLTLRNLLVKSSRTIIAGDISENPKLRIDYLKYIGLRQRIAVNFRYDYLNEKIPSYEAGLLKDVDVSYEHNFTLGFITTQSLRNSLLIGATYQLNTQKQKFYSIIPEGIKHGNFNTLKGELLFTANTFNDRNYPTKGRELSVGVQTYFYNDYKIVYDKGIDTVYIPLSIDDITIQLPISENDFNNLIVEPLTPDIYGMVQFKFHRFYQVNKKFQIVPMFSTGVTLSTDSIGLFQKYKLGGNQRVRYADTRFIGLNYAEVSYENYALLGLFLQNVLFQKIYLKYGANFLLPYDYVPLNNLEAFDFKTLMDDNSMLGYGIELTYKSFLGPISLGISKNTRDSYFRYYLAVGFSFNYSD
jgi:NTE family protein